jgi:hypothetical protein
MSMVWPCPLAVDVYAMLGRAVKVPRPQCPSCSRPMVFWSGYSRHVRWQAREGKIFIPRVRCRGCGVTHALLPAFVLARRLDAAESAGAVIGQAASGRPDEHDELALPHLKLQVIQRLHPAAVDLLHVIERDRCHVKSPCLRATARLRLLA